MPLVGGAETALSDFVTRVKRDPVAAASAIPSLLQEKKKIKIVAPMVRYSKSVSRHLAFKQ